uniref:Protein translocase subunit SecE n=1 Tax=Candidatus Kentrum sp. DK TaxID=2126562 RepID=A0A450SM65_9GAMM|nr:MAG: preprotein translocase, SecE subunit [Candidatus Kentron sp. DK]
MVTRSKDNKTDKKIEKTGSVNKDKVGKKEGNSGIPDGIKWFSAVLILAVAIGGFYYSVDGNWPWLLRVVGLIGAFGLVGAILLQTTQGQLAWNTIKEARMEGRKVVIPDGIGWFSSVLILAVAIGGFYYFVDDWPWLLRVVGLIGAFGFAGGILLQTTQGRLAWNTIKEARMEVRKVVWPTRKETVQTTMIVVVVVFLMAMVLWLLDGLLGWIMRYLLGQGG